MAERAHIPSSPACGLWETLLADALDGLLRPEDEAEFSGHMAACRACAALFEEARRGREWLEFLEPEPEVPEGLLERILAQTGPGHRVPQPALAGAGAPVLPATAAWQRPGILAHVRRWAEPRLMMTAAMAFFSIALTLNLAGVRLTEIRMADLRPTAVRSFMERRITMASVPIIRYYDHLRLVYEVQLRMRELRNESEETPPQKNARPGGQGESKKNGKDGGSRMEPMPPAQQPAQAIGQYDPDYLETSMHRNRNGQIRAFRRLQTIPAVRGSKRSRVWIA